LVANEERIKDPTVMKRPRGPAYGRSFGYRVRSVKVKGIMRYMRPLSVVPTVAMDPGETPRNGDKGDEV
jgi:hypothetical protein